MGDGIAPLRLSSLAEARNFQIICSRCSETPLFSFSPPVNRRSRSAAKSAFATGSVAIHIRRDVIGTQFTGVSGIRARRPIRCNETVEHARRHKFGQSSRLISPAGGRSARMVHPLPKPTRSSVSAPDPSILPYSLPSFSVPSHLVPQDSCLER